MNQAVANIAYAARTVAMARNYVGRQREVIQNHPDARPVVKQAYREHVRHTVDQFVSSRREHAPRNRVLPMN